MFKTLVQKYTVVFLLLIVLTGFVLRLHNYSQWPREGATFDEYAWTWLGINIFEKGVPISWSPHPQYKIRTHYIQNGARFWLVQPYLEHPPLFGLISGGYAMLRGIPDMYHVKLPVMRELALILGLISICMVYLLGSSIYGPTVGLLSAFIYAITPTVVIGSRIVQNENFFIPMFLGILYCTVRFIEKNTTRYLIAAAILSGLVTLAKVPWFAASVGVTLILLNAKKYRSVWIFWAIVFSIFSIFLVYGFMWDKNLFISLWKLQLNRYDLTFDSIFALINLPYLVDRYFTDGWIYTGWAAFILLLGDVIKVHRYIIFGLLGYFFIFVLAIPNEPSHGWYRYPFYPFLAIALSVVLHKYFNKNYLITSLFLLLTGLSLMQHTWFGVFGFSYAIYRGYIALCAVGTLPLWFAGKNTSRVSTCINYLLLFIVTLFSIWTIFSYNEQ